MTRSALIETAGRLLVAFSALAPGAAALAQDLGGTYQVPVEQGTITVQLTMQGERFFGYLDGPGVHLELEGWVEEGVGVGVASSPDGQLGFEAALEGDTLGLWFYEVVDGVVRPETEIEVILTRVSGGPAAQPGGPAAGAPPPGAGTPAPQRGSPVIATGQYASLTQDDATAFIEALEFVLAEMGYAYTFTPAERTQALQAIAQSFPALSRSEQVVLSQARAIWERVRANWANATPAEQQEFAVGVLVLAFGEQTVAQWVGTGGGGSGGGGQCTTFEDCAAGYVDGDTWSDTFNAQGCWAAAGCEGYDPSTGTFDYGSYEGY